ncbi:MAG: PfkB family carbohydrate kinase, partial [Sphingomonadaceae bacterium]
LGEMERLAGRSLRDGDALVEAANTIVESGGAEIVVVSMGHEGAILVRKGNVLALPAIPVEARSAVGAGDSFVAGMTYGLVTGRPIEEAFRLGIAAGTAAVLTPGTDLCHRNDVERLAATLGVRGLDGGEHG